MVSFDCVVPFSAVFDTSVSAPFAHMEACIAAESPATKARPLEQSSAPAPKRQRLESDSGPCDVDAMDLSAECVDALPLPPRRSRRLSSANKQPCTRPVQPPASRRQPVEVPSVPKSARQKGQNDGASHKSAACSRNGKRVQPADGAPAANGAPAAGNRADKSKTQKGKPEPSSRPPQGKARPQQKAKAEAEAPQTEWQVMFAEDDPEEVRARSEVKRILERFVVAREEAMKREVKRVEKEGGVMRPDLVGMRMCIDKGDCMYRTKRAGTLPGLPVGTTMLARAELSVLGLHHHWLAGIDAIDISKTPSRAAPRAPAGAPAFPQLSATDDDAADAGGRQLVTEEYYGGFVSSVMVSGMYEDDHDADGGERFIYTGEGGNDMLGNKKQVSGGAPAHPPCGTAPLCPPPSPWSHGALVRLYCVRGPAPRPPACRTGKHLLESIAQRPPAGGTGLLVVAPSNASHGHWTPITLWIGVGGEHWARCVRAGRA